MKAKITIFMLAALCGVSVYFLYYLKSEESKIKEKFVELASWVDKKEKNESLLSIAVLSHTTENIFAPKTVIDIHYTMINGKKTPDDISHYAVRARSLFEKIELTFHDITVDIYSANNAHVVVTAYLVAESNSRLRINDITELDCELEKVNGKWLFSEIKTVDILKK